MWSSGWFWKYILKSNAHIHQYPGPKNEESLIWGDYVLGIHICATSYFENPWFFNYLEFSIIIWLW